MLILTDRSFGSSLPSSHTVFTAASLHNSFSHFSPFPWIATCLQELLPSSSDLWGSWRNIHSYQDHSREELEGLHLWWQLPLKLPYSCGDTTFCLFVLDSTINVTDKGPACSQRSTRRLTLLGTIRIMCSNLLKQVQCEEGISAEQMALMFPWPDLEAAWCHQDPSTACSVEPNISHVKKG